MSTEISASLPTDKAAGMTLLFIDLETGGLSGLLDNGRMGCQYYPIFQIALIVTDQELQKIAPPMVIHVHQTEEMIARCHEWAINQHTKTGLLKASRESGTTLAEAEDTIIEYLKAFGINAYDRASKIGPVMAGNSITLDRMFISAQMPKLDAYMHYRQIDISSVAMLGRAMGKNLLEGVDKRYTHNALDDIEECLIEARHYCRTLFNAEI
jgi:oligoribonuclease (3'-5' exoribonuclease)